MAELMGRYVLDIISIGATLTFASVRVENRPRITAIEGGIDFYNLIGARYLDVSHAMVEARAFLIIAVDAV